MSDVVAGWYDDGSGRQRWWDGSAWTDNFADEQQSEAEKVKPSQNATVAAQSFGKKMSAKHDMSTDADAIWTAVGKPLTGIGAGRYKLTAEYLIFEVGTLSSRGQQIRTREIFDVDSSQTMSQKARGIGSITLWARRTSGDEKVTLADIPNFREGVNLINRVSDEARHSHQLRERTSHSTVSYGGQGPSHIPVTSAPATAAPQTASISPGADLNAELERLANFKAQGILTDEEFTAAKRKLLGL